MNDHGTHRRPGPTRPYTQNQLHQALLKLLLLKPLDRISTSELCREADINRNTFYKHYRDPLDLLQKIERSYTESITQIVCESLEKNSYETMIRDICQKLYESPEISQALITRQGSIPFLDNLIEEMHDPFLDVCHRKGTRFSDEELEVSYEYIAGGIYQTLRHWVHAEMKESPEEVAAKIGGLSARLIHSVFTESSI
ncbi:MAG: TetR family transcriptional regulator C-terminal domain-containing protein [Clostridia bacterium]|nr:TetR family transcriptional regulator C-terminal domain-containing protein [Clostridia bacterium]